MAGIFRYETEFMDEDAALTVHREKGILAAKSYKHAVKKLCKWVGENNLMSFKMTELYDILPDEEIEEEIHKNYTEEK